MTGSRTPRASRVPLPDPDRVITALDNALRTLFARAQSARSLPGASLPEGPLNDDERRLSVRLMRVNHSGEVSAQALYQGQMAVARDERVAALLARAAREETEHLAWTERRLEQLGGRRSLLDPLWYFGSFALGAASGFLGDRWNLGFLAETERQVESHLHGHLERLPANDQRSRAIVEQMRNDEAAHAVAAQRSGAAELPGPVRLAMRLAARVMTRSSHWL
jgi:ubiquinone biosynthesis monooxygenase Coq7